MGDPCDGLNREAFFQKLMNELTFFVGNSSGFRVRSKGFVAGRTTASISAAGIFAMSLYVALCMAAGASVMRKLIHDLFYNNLRGRNDNPSKSVIPSPVVFQPLG